jgi:hypothetical protein
MLIVALVLAVIGLISLVTAVVTSNEIIAWVCIGASVVGVLLLIVDAIRERQRGVTVAVSDDQVAAGTGAAGGSIEETYQNFDAEYPEESVTEVAEVTDVTEVGDPETSAVDTEDTRPNGG